MTFAFGTSSLLIASAALLVGLVLLWLGLRGRRVGDEPRCRKCNYNLTGATSQVCSECGAAIDDRGVVQGTRRRKPVLIAMAALVLLLAISFGGLDGYRRLQTVNKYRYYPTAWLMSSASAGIPQAFTELDRRVRAGELSEEQVQQLIADGLEQQSASATNPTTQGWVNVLDHLHEVGKLSETQQRQYFEQIRSYSLVVRPSVRVGDPIPVEVHYQSRGADTQFGSTGQARWLAVRILDVYVQPVSGDFIRRDDSLGRGTFACGSTGNGIGATASCGPKVLGVPLAAGAYLVSCEFEDQVFAYGVEPLPPKEKPIHRRRLQLSKELEVLPADAPDTLELLNDPALTEEIRNSLHVGTINCRAWQGLHPQMLVNLTIETGAHSSARRSLPMDTAFDVYIRGIDAEWLLGSVVLNAETFDSDHIGKGLPQFTFDSVDIVLRTSAEAAKRTVNLTKIWDGEIVFEDVKVEYELPEIETPD